MGWIRPVVLMPVSAFTGLTPQQIEIILAHELAHIRRHDYIVNLGQIMVEILLFYHPAVWWVSDKIRQEREYCCDDVAVSLCGDRLQYARALANLESMRVTGQMLFPAATGGALLARIQRLVGEKSSVHDRMASSPVFVLVVTLLILFSGIMRYRSFDTIAAEPDVKQDSAFTLSEQSENMPDLKNAGDERKSDS
jgi:beta-lactamase regulating signal transducer with metallopeptidase domain